MANASGALLQSTKKERMSSSTYILPEQEAFLLYEEPLKFHRMQP